MSIEKINKSEVRDFIKLIQELNEQEQAGVLLMVQGARLFADKKKKAEVNLRFHP